MSDSTPDNTVLQLVKGSKTAPIQANSHIKAINQVAEHPALTLHERSVINFIIHRTLKYGKIWERIPYRHFVDGVWSQATGECVLGAVGLSRAVVARIVASLRKEGIIISNQNRLSLRLQGLTERRSPSQPETHNTSIISNHSECNPAGPGCGEVESMKTVQELLRESDQANKNSVKAQHLKYTKKGLDTSAFQHFWAKAMARSFDRFPAPIALTIKSAAILKGGSKGIAYPEGFNMEAFANDLVDQWPFYRKELAWANIPQAPDIGTVARLIKYFAVAYTGSNRADYDDKLATDKRHNAQLLKTVERLQREVNDNRPKLEQLERERRVVQKQLDAGHVVNKELRKKDQQIANARKELLDLRMRLVDLTKVKDNDK